jgi:hypothetical protein
MKSRTAGSARSPPNWVRAAMNVERANLSFGEAASSSGDYTYTTNPKTREASATPGKNQF